MKTFVCSVIGSNLQNHRLSGVYHFPMKMALAFLRHLSLLWAKVFPVSGLRDV